MRRWERVVGNGCENGCEGELLSAGYLLALQRYILPRWMGWSLCVRSLLFRRRLLGRRGGRRCCVPCFVVVVVEGCGCG